MNPFLGLEEITAALPEQVGGKALSLSGSINMASGCRKPFVFPAMSSKPTLLKPVSGRGCCLK